VRVLLNLLPLLIWRRKFTVISAQAAELRGSIPDGSRTKRGAHEVLHWKSGVAVEAERANGGDPDAHKVTNRHRPTWTGTPAKACQRQRDRRGIHSNPQFGGELPLARNFAVTEHANHCLLVENGARDELTHRWIEFSGADRTHWMRYTTAGGGGTYTGLLTCLEMELHVRNLPAKNRSVANQ
jgi:hypothetical protein